MPIINGEHRAVTRDEWLAGVTQDGIELDRRKANAYRRNGGLAPLPSSNIGTQAKPDQLPAPNPVKTSPGLGDAVSAALALVGVTEERVSAWIGAPCGCAQRRAKLNAIGSWAARVLLGERSEPPLE